MSSDDMVKLTDEGIKWMVKRVSSENFTVKQASRTYGITERRVQQLTKMYRDTGDFPIENGKRKNIRTQRLNNSAAQLLIECQHEMWDKNLNA